VEIPEIESRDIGVVEVPAEHGMHVEMSWALVDPRPGDVEAISVAARVVASDPDVRRNWYPLVTITELSGAAVLRLGGRFRDRSRAIEAARAAFRDIAAEGVPPTALPSARMREWTERLEELERQERQAADLGSAWVRGEDPSTLWGRLIHLYELDEASVADAVRRLVSPHDYTVTSPAAPPEQERSKKRSTKSPWARIHGTDPSTSALYEEILAIPRAPPEPRWRIEGVDWTRTVDGRVIAVRNPLNTLFQATLTWPLGERHRPGVCEAVGQLGVAAMEDPSLKRAGVFAGTRPAECGWDHVTIRVKGPASGIEAAAAWATRLRENGTLGRAPAFSHLLFRGFGGRRWLHARYGAVALDPPVPPLSDPPLDRTEHVAAIHWLAGFTPDIRFAGPLDALAVSALFPSGPRTTTERPVVLRPRERQVEIWPGSPSVGLVKIGEPYDPTHEGLYALYERWLGGPTGIVAEELRVGTGRVYSVDVDLQRGRRPGEANVLEVKLSGRRTEEEVVTLARTLGEIVTRTGIDDAAWNRLHHAALTHAISDPVPFRSAAARLGRGVDRGLDRESQEIAAHQVSRLTKADFEEFLRREAAIPVTFVLQGSTLGPGAASSLGVVRTPAEK
jgi:hypothetical protein